MIYEHFLIGGYPFKRSVGEVKTLVYTRNVWHGTRVKPSGPKHLRPDNDNNSVPFVCDNDGREKTRCFFVLFSFSVPKSTASEISVRYKHAAVVNLSSARSW